MFLGEQKAQNENRFLPGRQIAFMICDSFRITGTGESIWDFSDLMGISLRGDNVQGFETKWDEVFLSMKKIPEDGIYSGVFVIQDETRRVRTIESSLPWHCILQIQCAWEKNQAKLD